jgi:hypothetical protein
MHPLALLSEWSKILSKSRAGFRPSADCAQADYTDFWKVFIFESGKQRALGMLFLETGDDVVPFKSFTLACCQRGVKFS